MDLIPPDIVESKTRGCQAGTFGHFLKNVDFYGTRYPPFCDMQKNENIHIFINIADIDTILVSNYMFSDMRNSIGTLLS